MESFKFIGTNFRALFGFLLIALGCKFVDMLVFSSSKKTLSKLVIVEDVNLFGRATLKNHEN